MVADVEKPIHTPFNTRFLADWQRQGGAQMETLAQRAMLGVGGAFHETYHRTYRRPIAGSQPH